MNTPLGKGLRTYKEKTKELPKFPLSCYLLRWMLVGQSDHEEREKTKEKQQIRYKPDCFLWDTRSTGTASAIVDDMRPRRTNPATHPHPTARRHSVCAGNKHIHSLGQYVPGHSAQHAGQKAGKGGLGFPPPSTAQPTPGRLPAEPASRPGEHHVQPQSSTRGC